MRSEPSVIERQRKLGATCARATVVEDARGTPAGCRIVCCLC